ncbi:hypothetical protein CVT24_006484 [Panaeolus cyanescens]|uniref:Retrotransposon gag domain-containing protein n=1 Tax=Panaeolus cyanescens TaxID=181874 RepID=A0A409WSX7_9AGAR|nr:hypothetical protein CVT24_006484 [Panaeolus cyanescens]
MDPPDLTQGASASMHAVPTSQNPPAPQVAPVTSTPQPQATLEDVVRGLLQSNEELKTWQGTAENTFARYGEILNELKGVLGALVKTREETPLVTSTSASPSIPSTPHPTSHHIPPHLPLQPTYTQRSGLKPNLPPTYNGDRTKGQAFLNACDAYYHLRPEDFRDTQTRIRWVLTYMTADRAAKWSERFYTWERNHPGETRFPTWDSFETAFRREFFPRDPEQEAMNRLDTDSYWQRNRTLDVYLDEFYDLAKDANLSDQRTLVRRFRRGLKASVQTEIATRYKDKPGDDDLEAWIEAARCIEDSHAANTAFLGGPIASRTAPLPPRKIASNPQTFFVPATRSPLAHSTSAQASQRFTSASNPAPQPNVQPSKSAHTTRWAHQTPSAGNPVPMDIDAARRQGELPSMQRTTVPHQRTHRWKMAIESSAYRWRPRRSSFMLRALRPNV